MSLWHDLERAVERRDQAAQDAYRAAWQRYHHKVEALRAEIMGGRNSNPKVVGEKA